MSSTDDLSELPLLRDELLEDDCGFQTRATPQPRSHSEKYDFEKTITGSSSHYDVLRHRKCRRAIIIAVILSSLTTFTLMLAAWTLSVRMSRAQPFVYDEYFNRERPGTITCGNTTDEAISRGCRFDELADLWLPTKCSNAFEKEYLKTNNGGPFVYWTDTTGQHLVSNRSLYVGGNTYFSTTRDHLVHCEYNLYRFAHALKTGEPIGHDGTFSDHMHHCANMLGMFANKAPGIDNIDVTTESGFGYC